MRNFLDSEVLKVIIIQTPADIIVAAEIVLEHIISRKSGNNIKLTAEQRNISGCNGVPGARHGCYVVEKMAFRFIYSSEIWNNLFRSHNDFSEKKDARADDLADHTHHTNDGVNLWQVTAVGSKLFPDVRHSIKTNDINTLVCKVKHVKDHLIENDRVSVVQIPLVWIESGHDMFVDIIQPCEVSRCSSREYLRAGLLIQRRNIVAVKEEVAVLIFFFTGTCTFRPLMILGSVVHNEVEAYTDSTFVAFRSQVCEIIHVSEFFLYLAEISYSISAIAASFRRLKKWHQMQVIYIAFLYIVQFLFQIGERTCKSIDIHHHSGKVVALVPFRVLCTADIGFFEVIASHIIKFLEYSKQVIEMHGNIWIILI